MVEYMVEWLKIRHDVGDNKRLMYEYGVRH